MAKPILAATPLSHNDIAGLAQLFTQAFRYHRKKCREFPSSEYYEFLRNIRTVVGLSFSATLVNGDLLEMFDSYLSTFLQHQAFLNSHSQPVKLGLAIANMVSLGSDFFRCLDHPHYYQDFLIALRFCLIHIIEEISIKPPLITENVISLILSQNSV